MDGMSTDSLRGRLLVANPRLPDPNFDRTVVLVLAHGDDGALGVVLNRPTDTGVAEALPGWEAAASPPAVVFSGGPVDPTTVVCLALRPPGEEGEGSDWSPLEAAVGTLDMELGPPAVGGVHGVRMFAGYAGWGPGQLENEIEQGGWFVLDAAADDAVCADPDRLWRRVLRRQGTAMALVAAYPADPSMN